jgi:hypothetical protein
VPRRAQTTEAEETMSVRNLECSLAGSCQSAAEKVALVVATVAVVEQIRTWGESARQVAKCQRVTAARRRMLLSS